MNCHEIGLIHLLRVTLAPFWRASTERKERMLFCVSITTYVVYVQIKARAYVMILSKMAPGWHGGDELLNKVIFVFFAHKKCSRSFVKLRLNPWCHMDYFNDVLLRNLRFWTLFIRELTEFIKNIFICVPKMNEGLMGLERHEGE